jgi:S1-C subfamily serine protease
VDVLPNLDPRNRIIRNDPALGGLARFFELADVGVAVGPAAGGLAVRAVAAGKPFLWAGCRTGDLLLAVDGRPVADPEALRVALRRKAAQRLPAVLLLRRQGKLLSLRVRLND